MRFWQSNQYMPIEHNKYIDDFPPDKDFVKIGNVSLFKLDKIQKSKITSERQSILAQFLEEINKERVATKWKPMTGKGVAMKLSHLKDNNTLYYFLSQCKDYKHRNGSFSKYFFGALKVK